MKQIFRRGKGGKVPDGTLVFSFLNPTDSTSDLPVGLFDGVSIAQGEIGSKRSSMIQMHPLVTVVVWVIGGRLDLRMRDPQQAQPYELSLGAEEAAVALPGTFFQLMNRAPAPCRVLYIVSPPYVFLQSDDGTLVYDDAVVTDLDWDALAEREWQLPAYPGRAAMRAERGKAIEALKKRKGGTTRGD